MFLSQNIKMKIKRVSSDSEYSRINEEIIIRIDVRKGKLNLV
jgi:hypothetical protein